MPELHDFQVKIIEALIARRDRCACYSVGMVVCRHSPTVDEIIEIVKDIK